MLSFTAMYELNRMKKSLDFSKPRSNQAQLKFGAAHRWSVNFEWTIGVAISIPNFILPQWRKTSVFLTCFWAEKHYGNTRYSLCEVFWRLARCGKSITNIVFDSEGYLEDILRFSRFLVMLISFFLSHDAENLAVVLFCVQKKFWVLKFFGKLLSRF